MIRKTVKKIVYDLVLIFINYIVAYIPAWSVRKIFYMIFGMKIGEGSRINQRVFIYNPWNIRIGDNTIINAQCILDGRGGLEIGSNSSISSRAIIYSSSHKTFSSSFEYYEKKTFVGDCCWIGASAIILPGSVIKDMAVIGANSVYKGIANEKGIYTGNPAQFVKYREIDGKYALKYREFFT